MQSDASDDGFRVVADAWKPRLRKRGLAISISGIDGSGKTTLARDVVQILQRSGIRARYLHWYQWYVNALSTPLLLLYNRYLGREVLVFDRSVYDNAAVALFKLGSPPTLVRVVLSSLSAIYPKFDYRIYLVASLEETQVRRPGTYEKRYKRLSRIFDEIARRARYVRLQSDSQLLQAVLSHLRHVTSVDEQGP
jgi:adenylate kinase family enzyme